MLCSCESLDIGQQSSQSLYKKVLAFTGRHMSQVWTGTPFFARLIRPVTGVYFTGTSGVGCSDPLEDCGGLPDRLAWVELPTPIV